MTYEAWRISYQSSEAAAKAAYAMAEQLRIELLSEQRHHGQRNASATRTLIAMGYTWKGGDVWVPSQEPAPTTADLQAPPNAPPAA